MQADRNEDTWRMLVNQRYRLDLNKPAKRQCRHLDRAARRWSIGKGLTIDCIYGGEIGHVCQKDRRFDNPAQIAPSGLQYSSQILYHLSRLFFDTFGEFTRLWNEAKLSREKNHAICLDRL